MVGVGDFGIFFIFLHNEIPFKKIMGNVSIWILGKITQDKNKYYT